MGNGIQAASRRTNHAAQGDSGLHRTHGSGHPFRSARTGLRRGVDRFDGDAAQPGSGQSQRRQARRHGDCPKGRRRDPRGSWPGAVTATSRCTRVAVPGGLSRLRSPARAARKRERSSVPQHCVPCAGVCARCSLWVTRRDGHRGSRREVRWSVHRPGPLERRRRHLLSWSARRRVAKPRPLWRDEYRQPIVSYRRLERAPPWQPAVRLEHPSCWVDDGSGVGQSIRRSRRAGNGIGRRNCRRRGRRLHHCSECRRMVRRRRQSGADRTPADCRAQLRWSRGA